jgi:Fur family ferric uptake transcriptional regulator
MERKAREAKERIGRSRYRLTRQRNHIIETLAKYGGEHLSAEELHAKVTAGAPEIGLATVYRTLEMLEHLGVVEKTNFGDGRARYELATSDSHRHHHLVCLKCGAITGVKDDLLQQLERVIEREHLFTITDHRLEFYGYCRDCRP